MLHDILVLSVALVGGCVGGVIGWIIDEIEKEIIARRQQRHERALLALRQARAIRNIDRITTAAVAQMLRIASEELPYA